MLLRAEGLGNHNSSGWRFKVLTPQVWCGKFTTRVVMLLTRVVAGGSMYLHPEYGVEDSS